MLREGGWPGRRLRLRPLRRWERGRRWLRWRWCRPGEVTRGRWRGRHFDRRECLLEGWTGRRRWRWCDERLLALLLLLFLRFLFLRLFFRRIRRRRFRRGRSGPGHAQIGARVDRRTDRRQAQPHGCRWRWRGRGDCRHRQGRLRGRVRLRRLSWERPLDADLDHVVGKVRGPQRRNPPQGQRDARMKQHRQGHPGWRHVLESRIEGADSVGHGDPVLRRGPASR